MIMIVKRLFSLVFSIAAVHLYGQATTDILVIGNELTKCAPGTRMALERQLGT